MVSFFVAGAIYLSTPGQAHAANYVIPAGAKVFYCPKSVKPGDTLTLTPGKRGPLLIRDCAGSQSNPVIIRNDPNGNGPTIISRSSGKGGFIMSCSNCVGVAIDGSYKWKGAPSGKTYGIVLKVDSGGSPTALLSVRGLSRFVTIRNLDIGGSWPKLSATASGIRVNDYTVKRKSYPTLWREGILIENNYIHDVGLEGMYVGPNYANGDLPLRNIEIRNNRVENTGHEGINTKSMWEGNNSIHHNVVRKAGANSSNTSKDAQYSGIKNNAGTVKIHNNWVETTGQHGIQVWTQEGPMISEGRGPFEAQIWNNVIVDAGALWRPFMNGSFGISVGAQQGREKPIPQIYSNTIINPRQSGINVTSNAGPGLVRDNIIAGAGANPIIKVPSFVQVVNNRVGPVSQMGFVNPASGNYRLSVGSPARNQGTSNFPPTDFDDVSRPKGGSADQGAFEATN